MHEIGMAKDIIELVKHKLKETKLKGRISKINLTISKSAAISPESLKYHFWEQAKDTGFEGVLLLIEEASTFAVCQSCGLNFAIRGEDLFCPACKSSKVGVVLDQQVVVESIEVE